MMHKFVPSVERKADLVLEPPSKPLQKLLLENGLCSERDLHRCRSRVKRLARDLPAFDSVWLDALVYARVLTAFQARTLESMDLARLRVGPCVLVDKLGHGMASETFLARLTTGNERCVVKLVDVNPACVRQVAEEIGSLVEKWKTVSLAGVVVPHAVNWNGNRLATVSNYVAGPHLGELLLRRGRFPSAVVHDLGAQILDALSQLEARETAHGEIRLRNVRLRSSGSIVLVDAGISPALMPELTIHAGLPSERYEGIAPELIGTGNRPTTQSDLYAVGCLLWQLLAGRPPFPTADPLAKLAAHQTRTVADVREWAPDTSSELAEAIARLTAADSAVRPQSARAALEKWRYSRRASRKRVAHFRKSFDLCVPRLPAMATGYGRGLRAVTAAALFAISGVVLSLGHQGARSELLSLAARVSPPFATEAGEWLEQWPLARSAEPEGARPSDATPGPGETQAMRLAEVPAPDADGVIVLDTDGPYAAVEISQVGRLVIRAAAGVSPEIVITSQPFKVSAEQLILENIGFRRDEKHEFEAGSATPPGALILIQAQELDISGCRFQTHAPELSEVDGGPPEYRRRPVAIGWKLIDRRDPAGGQVRMANSVFIGTSSAFYCVDTPRILRSTNCLKNGAGAMFLFKQPPAIDRRLTIALQQLTLRGASALIRQLISSQQEIGFTSVEAVDCMFDLGAKNSSLLEYVSARIPDRWENNFELTGEGSLANPEFSVAARIDPTSEERTSLPSDAVKLEGISLANYEFVGSAGGDIQDSAVGFYESPRRSPFPPGFDPQAAVQAGYRVRVVEATAISSTEVPGEAP